MAKKHHQVKSACACILLNQSHFHKELKTTTVTHENFFRVTNNRTKWCSSNSMIAGYHGYCGYITIGWSYTIGFHIPDGSNHLMTIIGFVMKFNNFLLIVRFLWVE